MPFLRIATFFIAISLQAGAARCRPDSSILEHDP